MADAYSREQRYYFIKVAESFLGKFYLWGGDDPAGFDCSGMVLEAMKSVGKIGADVDTTADGLWQKYSPMYRTFKPTAGCLAFWFTNGKATHVAVCISDFFCITADGGGSKTLTVADAQQQNAFIKIRPIHHRKTSPMYLDIFKE